MRGQTMKLQRCFYLIRGSVFVIVIILTSLFSFLNIRNALKTSRPHYPIFSIKIKTIKSTLVHQPLLQVFPCIFLCLTLTISDQSNSSPLIFIKKIPLKFTRAGIYHRYETRTYFTSVCYFNCVCFYLYIVIMSIICL